MAFLVLNLVSDSAENLRTPENVQETWLQLTVAANSQLLNWHLKHQSGDYHKQKRFSKCLNLAIELDDPLYLFFLNFHERSHGNSFITAENLDQSPVSSSSKVHDQTVSQLSA